MVSILILMDIALILVHTQLIAITHIQQSLKNYHYKNTLKKSLKNLILHLLTPHYTIVVAILTTLKH